MRYKYNLITGVERVKTKIDFSKTLMGFVALALPAAMYLSAGGAQAASTTKIVTPTNNQGWVFNPDPANATTYAFTEAESSTGEGSLFVEPIDAVGAHKFIALKTLGTDVAVFNSLSYDFMIAGDGTAADANQFYLNVYTNLLGSTTFYDCRFDYAPTTGLTTDFTAASFNATDIPTTVTPRGSAVCPTTLAGMPAGSTISAITLNVGDTSTSDTGLAGYFDNVVISNGSDVTTYNFELTNIPSDKNACKQGGWMNLTDQNGDAFKNQGQCVSWTNGRGQ